MTKFEFTCRTKWHRTIVLRDSSAVSVFRKHPRVTEVTWNNGNQPITLYRNQLILN